MYTIADISKIFPQTFSELIKLSLFFKTQLVFNAFFSIFIYV